MNRQVPITCGATKHVEDHQPSGAYWAGMGRGWLEIWRCIDCGALRVWGCSVDKPEGFETTDICPMETFWLAPYGEQHITITRESLGLKPLLEYQRERL